jgi:thymidine kinase
VKRFELTLDIEALLDETDKDKSSYIDYEEVRFLLHIAAVDEAIFPPPELVLRLYSAVSL